MAEMQLLPYTLRTGDAGAAGLGRKTLQSGREFVRVRRGLWVPRALDPKHPDVRIAAVVAQLPSSAVLGGWAAARLHERAVARDSLEVFDGGPRWEEAATRTRRPGPPTVRARTDGTARVVVCAVRESRLALRDDVRVFRSPVPDDERQLREGAPVTSPLRTAFDLARMLPRARALVAVDRLLYLGLVEAETLAAVVEARARWRGRPAARRIVALMDGAAESPQETLLRLLWLDAGFPRPRCNPVVRDRDGGFVARVDLIDPEAGVVGEYDGAVHADGTRRSDDARRQEELEGLGLVVIRATSADVSAEARGPGWQRRLRSAYVRASDRPRGARRWLVTDR